MPRSRRITRPREIVRSLVRTLSLGCLLLGAHAAHAQQGLAKGDGTPSGSADAGRQKASSCIGCHQIPGYKASFPTVYEVPMIIGQSSRYIESALQAYRKGDRSHPTMRAIAGSMSDQDIADLAAHYGSK